MAVADMHPDIADLEAFTLGTLDDASLADIESHVADCPTCQERAAGASGDALIELLRSAHARPPVSEDTPAPVVSAETMLWAAAGHAATAPAELAGHARYRLLRQLG